MGSLNVTKFLLKAICRKHTKRKKEATYTHRDHEGRKHTINRFCELCGKRVCKWILIRQWQRNATKRFEFHYFDAQTRMKQLETTFSLRPEKTEKCVRKHFWRSKLPLFGGVCVFSFLYLYLSLSFATFLCIRITYIKHIYVRTILHLNEHERCAKAHTTAEF